jgi:hypothetical protein
MPRRNALYLSLFLIGLAAFAAYAAWAVMAGSRIGLGWKGVAAAWPYLLGGVLTVACAIGFASWLAFFSERRGYDDQANRRQR